MTTEKTSPCSNCNGTGRVIAPTYLRELRQAYGLSLKAVAMRAGLSIPYISDLERGRRSLRGELAEELEAIIFAEAASSGTTRTVAASPTRRWNK